MYLSRVGRVIKATELQLKLVQLWAWQVGECEKWRNNILRSSSTPYPVTHITGFGTKTIHHLTYSLSSTPICSQAPPPLSPGATQSDVCTDVVHDVVQ